MDRGFLFSFVLHEGITDKEAFVKTELDTHFEFVEEKNNVYVFRVDKVSE